MQVCPQGKDVLRTSGQEQNVHVSARSLRAWPMHCILITAKTLNRLINGKHAAHDITAGPSADPPCRATLHVRHCLSHIQQLCAPCAVYS